MNLPLRERLGWGAARQSNVDATADRALMARTAAYLFAAGGTLTLALLLTLPHPEADELGMLVTVAAAYAVSAGVLAGFDRIPEQAFQLIAACGTVLITFGIYFRGVPATAHPLFYLWVAFYAFYFFTRARAMLQLSFVAVLYSAVLLIRETPSNPVEVWLITVGTLVVAGALVSMLKERIDGLVARLADAARTDALTGLLNRRGLEEVFDLEFERARRSGDMLSLLVGDLDRFKAVNDRFGHHAGDDVLERFGAVLQSAKRRIDTAARTGGEEFALVAPETDEHRAYMLAERLRSEVRRAFSNEPVPLTISFGIASFPRHGETARALMHAADQALYAAKELGRDRSVIHNSEIAGILPSGATDRDGEHEEHLATVLALAETIDMRDSGTAGHSQTVGRYAEMTAQALGLPSDIVERVRLAGILHDIGKIGISDSVLRKPGPLTDEERDEINKHPDIGARILNSANLEDVSEWVLAHHERPDGRGFPRGTAGKDIPLGARILAVADAYEAMTSDRVYQRALGHDQAQAQLARHAGTQFDDRVVDAFIRSLEREGAAV